MAAGGTTSNVKLGPGRLYFAPLGTTEPTNCSAALPSSWIAVGYTENGTEITIDRTAEDIMVAEEIDPIARVTTSSKIMVKVEMAETTKRNLILATGGGAAGTNDSTPFELAEAGEEVAGVMLVWDELDTPSASNRRILFRSCVPSGTITTVRRKAPAKSTIQASFSCLKPSASVGPMLVFPNASGQV